MNTTESRTVFVGVAATGSISEGRHRVVAIPRQRITQRRSSCSRRLKIVGEGHEKGPRVIRERFANSRLITPMGQRLKQVALAIIVQVHRAPSPDVLEV